jgi:ribosomal protein S18 acetylase RimI-like enzyme
MSTPSESISIRHAAPSDCDAAWRLVDSCRADLAARGIAQWHDEYPTMATVAADIGNARLFLLAWGGAFVGAVTLDANADPAYAAIRWESADPALIVHRLCVDPRWQGKGLGSRLMDFAEQHAASEGFASIRLDAYSGNPGAVALYRKRGYREAGQLYFPRRVLPFYLFERAAERDLQQPRGRA